MANLENYDARFFGPQRKSVVPFPTPKPKPKPNLVLQAELESAKKLAEKTAPLLNQGFFATSRSSASLFQTPKPTPETTKRNVLDFPKLG